MPNNLYSLGLAHYYEPYSEIDSLDYLDVIFKEVLSLGDGHMEGTSCQVTKHIGLLSLMNAFQEMKEEKRRRHNQKPFKLQSIYEIQDTTNIIQVVALTVPPLLASNSKAPTLRHLAIALFASGTVVYLSSDPAIHTRRVEFPRCDDRGDDYSKITSISAGASHFAACSASGHVFTWGLANEWGQMGDGTVWKRPEDRASQASSKCHTDSSNDIYTIQQLLCDPVPLRCFGEGDSRDTVVLKSDGNDTSNDYSVKEPSYKSPKPGICQVACGRYHTVFLTANRKGVYACGCGEKGQLGLGKIYPISPSPRMIKKMLGCPVKSIACPPDGDHTMILLETGKLLAFGDNTTGALGTGDRRNKWEPTAVIFSNVNNEPELNTPDTGCKAVSDGENKESICPASGSPESFLYPRRVKQLDSKLPHNSIAVKALSCSSTHTCVTTTSGEVYTCGMRPVKTIGVSCVKNIGAVGALGRDTFHRGDGDSFQPAVVLKESILASNDISDGVFPEIRAVAGTGFTVFYVSDPSDLSRNTVHIIGSIIDSDGRVVVGPVYKASSNVINVSPAVMPLTGAVKQVFPIMGGILFILGGD